MKVNPEIRKERAKNQAVFLRTIALGLGAIGVYEPLKNLTTTDFRIMSLCLGLCLCFYVASNFVLNFMIEDDTNEQ